MRQSGRADVFLRESRADARRDGADRNQEMLQKAQLRTTSIPRPAIHAPTDLAAIIERKPKMSSPFALSACI
jgi:hypothetical protein